MEKCCNYSKNRVGTMKKRIQKSRILAFGTALGLIGVCLLAFRGISFFVKKEGTSDREPRKFGATYMTMNNPYFVTLNNTIEETVESNGDILITRDPAQNQEKQNAEIQEMISEGVSAIFLNPADWKNVKPALVACRRAGIPVINIDTYVYDRDYVVSVIASDNYMAGAQCAEDMMKKRSKADIVVLDYPETQSTSDRVRGFKDKIAGNANYHVVAEESAGGELEIAMDVMDRIIQSGVRFDVVLGGNDPTALGSLAALQKSHWNPVVIYGVDGSPDAKNMIKEDLIEGTSAQRPMEIGLRAVEIAYDYLAGKKVPANVIVPVTMVTKDNLKNFDLNGWQ